VSTIMNNSKIRRFTLITAAWLCAAAAFGAGAQAATRSVDLHKPADPEGQVEVDAIAGSIAVDGWERPEIAVTGTIGEHVERVDLNATGDHASIRVVLPASSIWGGDNSADLVIHVPRKSLVKVSLVSADLATHELLGEQRLRTVSGNIDATVARDAKINSVSGRVHVIAQAAGGYLEVESISGNVTVEGPVDDIRAQTVSGNSVLKLASIKSARLKTISGDLKVTGSLAVGGRLEAGSVSGDLDIGFSAAPGVDYDVESHTGAIVNCFGPQPQTPTYGPGSHLVFRDGDGSGRVHLNSLSGTIRLCNHL